MSVLRLDHLAVCCSDLAEGAAWAEAALGVALAPGGQHAAMGTHNRLLSLGPGEYLEVIAINPAAPAPGRPRWFDLDRFAGPPRLANWVAATDDLDATLALAPQGLGRPMDLARGDLRWRMAVPDDGVLPFDGGFPALIQWQGQGHPAPRLPDHGIRLVTLDISHPQATALEAVLGALLDDPRLHLRQGPAAMHASFCTPNGMRAL